MRAHLLSISLFIISLPYCVGQMQIIHHEFQESQQDSLAPKYYISLNGENSFNTSFRSNQPLKDALSVQFVNNENKLDIINDLGASNRLGGILDANLLFKTRWKKNINLVAGLRGRNLSYSQLSGDALKLGLMGNKSFEDQTASLSPSNLTQIIHQDVYLGIEKMIDSSQWLLGGNISLQKTSFYRHITLENSSIYTAPYGKYLDMEFHYQKDESPGSAANDFWENKGLGLALNLYAIKWLKNGRLSIELKDIGFQTIPQTTTSSLDTSFKDEGIVINDFFTSSNQLDAPILVTILDSMATNNSSKTIFSKATIHVNYLHHFSPKWDVLAGIKQLFPSPALPRIYIRGKYKIHQHFSFGPSIAYGGFGRFDLGFNLNGKIGNHWSFFANINYLDRFIMPSISAGQGLSLGISSYI